jgi:hypothetical protein
MKMSDTERRRYEAYRQLSDEQRAEIREFLERKWHSEPCKEFHKRARWEMPNGFIEPEKKGK